MEKAPSPNEAAQLLVEFCALFGLKVQVILDFYQLFCIKLITTWISDLETLQSTSNPKHHPRNCVKLSRRLVILHDPKLTPDF